MGSRPSGRRGEVGDMKLMIRMKMVWESRKGKRSCMIVGLAQGVIIFALCGTVEGKDGCLLPSGKDCLRSQDSRDMKSTIMRTSC